MKKIGGTLALSLAGLALIGCGSGRDADDDAAAQQSGGTSEMMGGSEDSTPSLGTAEGESIEDVDVQMTPNMQHSPEEMTGEDEIKAQKPEPE